MKKTSKIVVALCVVLAIVMISVSSFASGITPSSFTAGTVSNTTGIINLGNQIIGVVRTVGVLVAVVILLILGIKYMMGSAEEKADYKKSMIPYIVGAVLIFAASTITGIVYDMAMSLNSSSSNP
ncbi:MAG: TrbC/VirB2 family protein [Clostridia bacterium]|nr:TrbC/VirB2 family protein [Clostridia bacterium]